MTNIELKGQIDTDITNKTLVKSISPTNVGKNLKDVIDYIDSNNKGVIEKTYLQLQTMITNSSLIKGQRYLLTDYMTTYTQPVTLVNKSSGVVEPLYLLALDTNKFSNITYSKLYPQDIVYYEFSGDINNYKGVEGFTKGKIYRRIDTQRNNDIGTDWRHIKYDRGGVDKLLFEDYSDCYNNVIKANYLFNNVIGYSCYSNNIGYYFEKNTIDYNFYGNVIIDNFYSNNIGDNFKLNNIGDNFNFNTIGRFFESNTIGDVFFENNILNNFKFNIIGNNFGANSTAFSFQNNKITSTLLSSLVNHITTKFILTNALSPTYLGTATGGGLVVAPVFHDGTNWVYN